MPALDRLCRLQPYGGPKEICVYHYNDHEGGGAFHQVRQLAWLHELFRSP